MITALIAISWLGALLFMVWVRLASMTDRDDTRTSDEKPTRE